MSAPIGGVWAMKSGDSQPTNFSSNGSGIQSALDYAGGAVGSQVYVGPGDFTLNSTLTMHGKTSLKGAGALCTRINLATGFTGVALREKTLAEGNISGATGITVSELGIYGVSTASGGIDFGNQGGASFNANAQIWDVLVRDFTGSGAYGIKLLANAIHCRNMWTANCDKGVWLINGGANHYDGLWAEQCTTSNLIVDNSPWNTFVHVQMEQSGATMTGPMVDLTNSGSDRNVFCGVYMALSSNLTNLIIARTGIIGTQFYGIRVVPNGRTYTNTVYTEGTATGTGAVDWIGFFNDMSNSGKHYLNDQTGAEQTVFTGARPVFPQATITTLNGANATLTGDITTGTAGVGASATFGQGTTGTDSATVRARSGSNAAAISQFILRQNTTDQAGFRYVAGDTYIDYGGTLRFRAGFSGTQKMTLNSAGALTPIRLVETVSALTDAATIATDASLANIFTVTLGDNRTMGAPSNQNTGQRITYIVTQDGTGGRTLGWNAAFKQAWSDTGNTLGKVSTISFIYNGSNWVQDGAQSPYS